MLRFTNFIANIALYAQYLSSGVFMSHLQGILDRSELPKSFVAWADDKFFRQFGYSKNLEYITWFGFDKPIFLDYNDPKNGLEIDMTIKELTDLMTK